jgi:hypothetical protein
MWANGTFKQLINTEVYCIELDTEYPSATKAGEILHLDPSSIRKTTKGKQKTCGGYHWKSLQKNKYWTI